MTEESSDGAARFDIDPAFRIHGGADPLWPRQVLQRHDRVAAVPSRLRHRGGHWVGGHGRGWGHSIAAGIGVWLRPRIFVYVVAAWLGVIIVTLAMTGGFWDIALRDLGLLLGALTLGQLAAAHADN